MKEAEELMSFHRKECEQLDINFQKVNYTFFVSYRIKLSIYLFVYMFIYYLFILGNRRA